MANCALGSDGFSAELGSSSPSPFPVDSVAALFSFAPRAESGSLRFKPVVEIRDGYGGL